MESDLTSQLNKVRFKVVTVKVRPAEDDALIHFQCLDRLDKFDGFEPLDSL